MVDQVYIYTDQLKAWIGGAWIQGMPGVGSLWVYPASDTSYEVWPNNAKLSSLLEAEGNFRVAIKFSDYLFLMGKVAVRVENDGRVSVALNTSYQGDLPDPARVLREMMEYLQSKITRPDRPWSPGDDDYDPYQRRSVDEDLTTLIEYILRNEIDVDVCHANTFINIKLSKERILSITEYPNYFDEETGDNKPIALGYAEDLLTRLEDAFRRSTVHLD